MVVLCLLATAAALAAPASAASVLTEVRRESGGYRLVLDWPTAFKAFRLSSPERFVVDLKDTLPATAAKTAAGSGPVRVVRIAPSGVEPAATRVVFDLAGPARLSAAAAPDGIAVSVTPAAPAPEGPDLKDALAPLAPLARPALPPPPALVKPAPGPAAVLLAVSAAPDRAALRLTRDVPADIFLAADPARLVIDLPGVRHGVTSIAAPAPGGVLLGARSAPFTKGLTRVVLDLVRAAPYTVEHTASEIVVTFPVDPALAPEPASRTRVLRGWVVGPDGRPLDGVFLVRFSVPEEGAPEARRWEEALYVDSRGGRFAAVLGRLRPLPADALSPGFPVDAAPPTGVSYRIVPR